MLQILIMGRNYSPHSFFIYLTQDSLSDSPTDLRLGASPEFVYQNQRGLTAASDNDAHVSEMRTVCAKIVFDRLVIAYVYEYVIEYTDMGIFIDGGKNTALSHILNDSNRLQAHRFTTCVRTGDDENAVFPVKFYIKRYDFLTLSRQRNQKFRMTRVIEFKLRFT